MNETMTAKEKKKIREDGVTILIVIGLLTILVVVWATREPMFPGYPCPDPYRGFLGRPSPDCVRKNLDYAIRESERILRGEKYLRPSEIRAEQAKKMMRLSLP